jgi:beta-fructofuranosidase
LCADTLPRSLLYDPQTRAHVTPPVPQTELLRKAKLHGITTPTELAANGSLPMPQLVHRSGMQLEVVATFALPLPAGTTVGVASRCSADGAQRTESFMGLQAPDEEAAAAALARAGVKQATVGSRVQDANGLGNGQKQLSFAMPADDTNVTLRVFVDHSVLETYAQGGRGVVTQRMYPTDDALGVEVFCAGPAGVTLLALEIFQIDTIWKDKV